MRRLIALTAAATLALALAPLSGARAQEEDLQVVVHKPGGNAAGHVGVDATIVYEGGVDSLAAVTVGLTNAAGQFMGRFCHVTFPAEDGDPFNGSEAVRSAHIQFKWDTTRIPAADGNGDCQNPGSVLGGPALSTNNTYKVQVEAVTYGFPRPEDKLTRTDDSDVVAVSNAPVTPGGVKLSRSGDAVSISWSRNPEPDVGTYRVQECVVDRSSKPCDGKWKTVKDNWNKTSIAFDAADPGIYRYRVAALRPAASGQTMVSGWASAQGEPTEIEVKEDPPAAPSGGEPQTVPGEPPPPRVETRTVVQPTRRVARAAPQVVQRIVEDEPGYNSELPYEEDGQAISGLPTDSSGDGEGQRAVLIPLAGGALLLVFAMQVHYLNRRAHAGLEAVPAESLDDWDD